jgi:hypothetical protein
MADEDFIEVRLDIRISEGFQIVIIQILPIFAAAAEIKTLIRMFLQQ